MTERTKTYVRPQGRMTFANNKAFAVPLEEALLGSGAEIVIDMREVDYIDSSVLGMLLVTRDKAKRVGKTISIQGCKEAVANIFEVARFGNLFEIS